jgi:Tfp pilus assembly protein PilX
VAEWVGYVTQLGVAGVLAVWLYIEQQRSKQERDERLAVQRANDELRDATFERMLKALHDAEHAVRQQTEHTESLTLVIEGMKNMMMQGGRQ